ncbi:hypothetical protein TNIN_311351 [Trichonephila inaurata madagascariensis]|uniref:Uncharacterized protein n=1 Tax=Trichonephila inaurata madagascariensis TaxID=2747483 RepID=A0A8X6WSY6_9ARAC|nr:hypothetical protein TNIN_311351 [Trichonephila inaurata madagascariensis]
MSGESGDLFNSTKKKGSLNLVLALVSWATLIISKPRSVKSVLMSSTSVLMGRPLMTTFCGRFATGSMAKYCSPFSVRKSVMLRCSSGEVANIFRNSPDSFVLEVGNFCDISLTIGL